MRFPFTVGAAAFGEEQPGPIRFHELLRRLYGTAYSKDPDSVVDRELGAWAEALAIGSQALDRAAMQAFPNLATQLLEDWERVYRLPNDAARTTEQRQARLVGAERATGGAQRDRVEAAIEAVAPDNQATLASTREMVTQDAAADAVIFQSAFSLSEAEYDDPEIRKAVAQIAKRLLPARGYGQHGKPDPAEAVIVHADAEWASADHQLDRDALRQQIVTAHSVHSEGPRARYREFGPLTKLRSEDLNEIQRRTLWGPTEGGGAGVEAYGSAAIGQNAIVFATQPSGTAVLDSSIDWLDRLVMMALVYSTTVDLRPGQAGDGDWSTSNHRNELWYTGTGAAGYEYTVAGVFTLQVNTGVGNRLELVDLTGGNLTVAGFLIAGGDTGTR